MLKKVLGGWNCAINYRYRLSNKLQHNLVSLNKLESSENTKLNLAIQQNHLA